MVHDDVWDIVPGSRDNQFQVALPEVPSSLRGSVDVCSIGQVLPHRIISPNRPSMIISGQLIAIITIY
jgi:hypothetical protein